MGRAASGTEREGEDEDERLVDLARQDRTAFASLYRRYVVPIHRYCARRLGSREAAEDATSLVFAKALASLPNYRAGPGHSFRAWLFTIAHHVVADSHRAARPALPLADAGDIPDPAPRPEEAALLSEERRSVRALLIHLPPAERQVIELRLAGLTGREIAAVLDKRQNAVDVAQFRAIRRLRAVLAVGTGSQVNDVASSGPVEEANHGGR